MISTSHLMVFENILELFIFILAYQNPNPVDDIGHLALMKV